MRIRLRKALSGISAGISLSRFMPGIIYEVDPATGALLLSWGAEDIPASESTVAIPLADEALLSDEQLTGGVTVIQAEAADHPRHRRILRRRRLRSRN
jgi:hypothetical protein